MSSSPACGSPPGSACLLVLVLWIDNPDIEDLKGGFRSRVVMGPGSGAEVVGGSGFKMCEIEVRQVLTERTREHLSDNLVLFRMMGRAYFRVCRCLCPWLVPPSAASTFHGW